MQRCSDEASGGWGLFDLRRVWNHGTGAAKAVCGGSAIRWTGLKLTVDVGFMSTELCAPPRQVGMVVTERVAALMKATRSGRLQDFFPGLFVRR